MVGQQASNKILFQVFKKIDFRPLKGTYSYEAIEFASDLRIAKKNAAYLNTGNGSGEVLYLNREDKRCKVLFSEVKQMVLDGLISVKHVEDEGNNAVLTFKTLGASLDEFVLSHREYLELNRLKTATKNVVYHLVEKRNGGDCVITWNMPNLLSAFPYMRYVEINAAVRWLMNRGYVASISGLSPTDTLQYTDRFHRLCKKIQKYPPTQRPIEYQGHS